VNRASFRHIAGVNALGLGLHEWGEGQAVPTENSPAHVNSELSDNRGKWFVDRQWADDFIERLCVGGKWIARGFCCMPMTPT
jgi:hypothetical protein